MIFCEVPVNTAFLYGGCLYLKVNGDTALNTEGGTSKRFMPDEVVTAASAASTAYDLRELGNDTPPAATDR